MGGLFHTLNIGSEALFANRQGVDTASHNIANAQVEGFSRQRVNLRPRPPTFTHGVLIGNGTHLNDITRSHDKFVEKQINRAHQLSGTLNAKLDAMKGLEGIYSPELSSNIADEITGFFNAIQDLSNSPEDMPIRTAVRETARSLSAAFRRVDAALNAHRLDLNERVIQETQEISDKLASIANLNLQIVDMEASPGAFANDLRDQRDLLLRQLTQKIEISYYEDGNGCLTIRGPNQVTLVDRGSAASVQVRANPANDGLVEVLAVNWEGNHKVNITGRNEAGILNGLLYARDDLVPDLILKNNQMAAGVIESVNSVHREGYGVGAFQDTVGRNFFRPISDFKFAARDMDVDEDIAQTTDAISIAAAPLTPGDNVLANELTRLRSAKIMDGNRASFTDFYANYVGKLGIEISRTENLSKAQGIVVQDLHAQRESVSGVSLDEEAVNLLKWQTAFTASSKVITTVDEMLETVLSIKR